METLLEDLNKQQLEAVTHKKGPLLIVAGAGTGKTTVITRKIAWLIKQKLAKPDEILALTFTEKAATEMQERVDILMPMGFYDAWISTFHSFCERILKAHALDIGISNDFELLNGTRQWILVYKNFEKFNLSYYRPLGSPNKFIDALLTHFSRCKDEIISPHDYLQHVNNLRLGTDQPVKTKRIGLNAKSKLNVDTEETEIMRLEEVANAFHVYQKLLLDNNYMDFGDLINYTLELLNKRPGILKYYQSKFKYILVDEFQDTNFAQYELVKLLAGKGGNLGVVGDDDQSIYKFRGASVSNILKFKDEYPNAKQITLMENYRSTQIILDLAYKFIQANNPDRLEIKLKINKHLTTAKKDKGMIEVLEGEDLSGELNFAVKKILDLKSSDNIATWNDFAILIRANSAADELLPILENAGIPHTFLANKGLYRKPIVLDVICYMRLLDNLNDSISLYRVFSLPKFHLTHEDLSALLEHSGKKTLSLFETLLPAQTIPEVSPEGKAKIRTLLELIKKHAVMAKDRTASEMAIEIISDLGLEQKLKQETAAGSQNRELLDQFYKKIEAFEKENEHTGLHNFLEILELQNKAGDEGEIKFDPNLGPESLKVLTIHSAKGLEFKYVFVINLVDQRFPTRQKKDAIDIPEKLIKDILPEGDSHLQEERRLFYVATTRAKTGLYLTWSRDYGGKSLKKPSRFLVETGLVPDEKINKATGKVIFTKAKNAHAGAVYKKIPTSFSYSALNDFQLCPLKYKYKYYLKLPMRGSHHLSFGSTIHKVFEEFLKIYKKNQELKQVDLFGKTPSENPLPEFKILENLYEKNWLDNWYPSKLEKSKYKKVGSEMLKVFYNDLKAHEPEAKYIETFFKLKLGNYNFVGKIDRADKIKQGLSIIDYKTGKAPNSKGDLDQLYVYQWAAQEFLKEKVVKLKYWYLQGEGTMREEAPATEKDISKLKEKLLGTIEQILDAIEHDKFKDLHKKIKSHNCEFEHFE
ncbi:MAG: hypothetical protein COT92_01465 [Candidatus Doudnabacteria bacterium CG10_big_fil_rev_8_21_14_0_10_42_18]|uniref:DNA 3'-5' helicase n=1 Tax=Candidatus Doudnabacteria bacterium CG10_big_fil_rev_8_21_14_0_10_42_18 TaxID=1974552 RepID=A0A2H0VBD1_9BACT|nr:MAG: hypothetical protein COT92_01465 [Candidatus Doudnabacteria bacterium CG10_big_fil_rev_8_21_14_0_10_42_18]